MNRFAAAIVLLAILGIGSTLQAQTWALGQPSMTGTGVTNYGGASGWNLGYLFTANQSGITVTHLAQNLPSSGAVTVTLWSVTTQAVLGQVTVSAGTGGTWRSTALATPVALTNGQQYIVAALATTADQYYGVNNTAAAQWHPTSGPIIHVQDRWEGTTNPNTFPTQTSGSWHWGVADIGYSTGPAVTASTATLNLGSTPVGTAGTAVSYTVSGSSTTNQTVITAPTGVQVSFSQTSGFANSITVTTTGNWGPTTVWARISASASQGSLTGTITHVSTGASSANVAVNGMVGAIITSSVSTVNLGVASQGTAGTPVSYTLNGYSLTGQTTITAPANVQVSFSQTSGYANSINVTTTGTWGPTTVWARIPASASVGTLSGNITHASTGATTVNVSVSGSVIAQTFPMALTSTTGLTSYNYPYNMGYSFSTTYANVQVTHLAAATPDTIAKVVCLWDSTAPGSPVAQTTTGTSATSGDWRIGTLSTPVTLVANRQYRVAVVSDDWFEEYSTSGPFHPSGVINWNDGCYDGGGTGSPSYPSNDSGGYNYGLADIGYTLLPALATSTATLNLGNAATGNPGTPVSYTVTGFNLSGQTTVTAPANTEISFSQTSGYAGSLTITTTGYWGPTTIWARVSASASQGFFSGNITHASSGATTINVAVSGSSGSSIVPSVTTLNLGLTPPGTAGTPVSYTVNGYSLGGQTTVTAPSRVEVSFSQASGYGTTLTITTTGTWGPTTIYARIAASAGVGAVSGNIAHSSSGTTTANVAVSGDVPGQSFPMQLTSTASCSTSSYNYNMGYAFSTAQSNVTVTHLAAATPDTAAKVVCLWDSTATSAPIGQTTTSAATTAGAWRIGALATPVTLVAGRQYRVAVVTYDWFYEYSTSGPFHPSGIINWSDGCYDGGGGTTPAYPSNNAGGYNYGLADIGYTTGPTLSTSVTTLNLGTTTQGTAGTPASYTVSGLFMTNQTVITAPTGVEISFSQTSGYGSSLTITTTPTFGPTTMWARITSTAAVGTISGNITHVSTGATTRNVAVNGTVTGPTISTNTGSINLGSTPRRL